MRADRRQGNHVGVRVDYGSAAGQVVSCATCRCRDENSISLYNGQKCVVNVDIKAAHEFSVATSDADLVQRVTDSWLHVFSTLAVYEHPLLQQVLRL